MRRLARTVSLPILLIAFAGCTTTGSSNTSGSTSYQYAADPKTGCKAYALLDPGEVLSWSGACADGYAEGDGTMTQSLKGKMTIRYKGPLSKGKRVGQGFQEWDDGTTYKGMYVDGLRNGKGVMTYPYSYRGGRSRYEGDFKNGDATGIGKMWYNDGDYYEGRFIDARIASGGKTAFERFGKDDAGGQFLWVRHRMQQNIAEGNTQAAREDFTILQAISSKSSPAKGQLEATAIEVAGYPAIWQVSCRPVGEQTTQEETRGAFGMTHTGWMTVREVSLACSVRLRGDSPVQPKNRYELALAMNYEWHGVVNGERVVYDKTERFATAHIAGTGGTDVSGRISFAQSRSSQSMGIASFNGESAMTKYVLKGAKVVGMTLK